MRIPLRLLVSALFGFASAKAASLTWDTNATNGSVSDYGSGTWDTNATNTFWNDGSGNVAWSNAPVNDAWITGSTGGLGVITIGANPLTVGKITVGGAGSTTAFRGTYSNLTANEILAQTSGAGKLAFDAGGTVANVAKFTVSNGATLFASGTTINSAIFVTGSGNNENLGAFRLDYGARLQGTINLTGNATFGSNTGSGYIDSTITGDYAFNQAAGGAGTLRLSGDNTYSGGTTLTHHTVQAGHNNAFGTGTLRLNGGALTSDSTTARTFANAVTIGGPSVTLGNATNSGKLTFSGAVQSGLASTIITAASAVEFADLRANGTVIQAGAGTMTVGRFTAQSSGAVLAGTSINLAAGGTTFDTAGYNAAVTGTLAGSSGFTKVGAGTLTLNSTHAFTGAVRVTEGTLHLAPHVSLPSNLDVMPLGDSITVGDSAGGYRAPLYNLIQPIAPGMRFVGDSSLYPGSLPAGQQNHAGHSSYSTLDIYRNLDGLDSTTFNRYGDASRNPNGGYWLTGGDGTNGTPNRAPIVPDVVLLLVGTNDVYRADTGVTDQKQSYTNLIDKLTTLRPEAEIFMAKITPHRDGGAEVAKVAAYNAMITLVYDEAKAAGKNVTLVDLNTGFPTGAFVDTLHPNQTGYQWMAARWRDAMVSTLGTATALDFRNTPLITVEAGAKLSGTALVNELVIRGAIAPGGDSTIGFIRAANTALSGNYLCELSADGADLLEVTGNLDLGGATLTLIGLEIPSATSYLIASYTGTLTGDFVTINGLPVGYQYVNDIDGKRLMLTQVPESSTYALFAGPALLLLARHRGVRRAPRRRARDEAPGS